VVPIQALLSRIRWDAEFGRGRWEIAFLDRHRVGLVRAPFEAVQTRANVGFVFEVADEDGVLRTIRP
jgi:hypothetical protein